MYQRMILSPWLGALGLTILSIANTECSFCPQPTY